MNIYTVAFFGHRYIEDLFEIEKLAEDCIYKLIDEKEYVEFLVGRNGDFDNLISSVIFRVRKNYRDDNSSFVLLLPYTTAEYTNNQSGFENYYSDIEISRKAEASYPKAAIQIRNREMVNRANLIICYIKEEKGGAYSAIQYAVENGKRIINLANSNDNMVI